MSYAELFLEHKDLFSTKWDHYLFVYQELLEKYIMKGKPVNILEIGVRNGGSLQIWKKFLPEGSQVYGVDIDPNCMKITFEEDIHFYLGDASSVEFWQNNLIDTKFDIILDDGSHMCRDVISSFNILFMDKLNDGGIYMVEDMATSYHAGCGGGYLAPNSSIEFFKTYIEVLNAPDFPFVNELDEKGKNKYNEMMHLNKYVKSVIFYHNICAVSKYSSPLSVKFTSRGTGVHQPVFSYNSTKTDKKITKQNADSDTNKDSNTNRTPDKIELLKKSFE